MSAGTRPTGPVLISAGGTGGHLFPARALSEELGRRGIAVELATDIRGQVYDRDFPARAVHIVQSATPVGGSPLRMAGAALSLARGVATAYRLMRRLRPAAVIGFGGYPTVPPLIAAWLAGVPALIHEQNAVMGRANRLLVRFSRIVATAVPRPAHMGPRGEARTVVTGNPLRDAVVAAAALPVRAPMADGQFHLLVFGGSQGAHVFSDLLPQALGRIGPLRRTRLHLVQQCRPEDLGAARSAYDGLGLDAELAPFFTDLPARIAAADLIVARSGASTVSEIAAIGRPAILVPLPHAIDNDQRENARALAAAGGALMIEQRELDADRLAREIEALMDAPGQLSALAAAARRMGRPQAVETLADLVIHVAGGGSASDFAASGQRV